MYYNFIKLFLIRMHDAMINSMLRMGVCFCKDYSESIAEDLVTVFNAKCLFKFHNAQLCY